jgi:hypothetical protein
MSLILSGEELPPTENLPIFDNSVFNRGTEGLTLDEARRSFLAFPIAQGNETLLDASVLGSLTATNLIFPSGEVQTNSATATFNESTTSEGVVYSLSKYLNSTINFSSNQLTSIFLPTPVTGRYLKIYNNCNFSGTLRITAITGTAGISTTTLTVQSAVGSLVVGSVLAINGKIVTITAFGSGSGGVGTYTITPSQATPITNGTAFTASILTNTFVGEYGNSDPSILLNPNSWSLLYATNTTSWSIVDRSANQIFNPISVTASITYEPHFNFLNAYVPFSPTSPTWQVTIPLPTSIFSRNKYLKIANSNTSNSLTIISTGIAFLGKYGSGTTSLTIPVNNWVELYSDGTNWLVNDRSSNFNYFLFGTGTTLNWSTDNNQYFDSVVEFVPPDNALNTASTVTGTATQSGWVLNVTSITSLGGNLITAGSVIEINSRKLIIRCQLSGTLGGTGGYLVNLTQTLGSNSFTAYVNTGILSSGTIAIATNQNTMYNNAVISSVPTGSLSPGPATIIGIPLNSTSVGSIPFYAISNTISGNCLVSTGGIQSLNTSYFSTSGTNITLPDASSSNIGRTLKIVNSSNNPIYFTTSSGLSQFNGTFGPITTTGVFQTFYILRQSETLSIKSDGTNWETQIGTSLGGAKAYVRGSNANTNTSDNVVAGINNFYTLDNTYSNLTGIHSPSAGQFFNYYPFSITVNISVVLQWSTPANATTTSPVRIGSITTTAFSQTSPVINSLANTTAIVNYVTYPFSILTPATGVMTPLAISLNQTFNGTFTLEPYEAFTVNYGKINGNSGTGAQEVLGSATVYINRVA